MERILAEDRLSRWNSKPGTASLFEELREQVEVGKRELEATESQQLHGSSLGNRWKKRCQGGDRRRAQARLAVQQAELAPRRSHVSLRERDKERSARERERE